MGTSNAAGEQVDVLTAVDEPHMDVDEEPSPLQSTTTSLRTMTTPASPPNSTSTDLMSIIIINMIIIIIIIIITIDSGFHG
ncbi:hypothetical protein NX059_012455 [Plenodomus lindquistii]|nr:hypothetical protein NX059_012455 [Plenodomus lindquistii]